MKSWRFVSRCMTAESGMKRWNPTTDSVQGDMINIETLETTVVVVIIMLIGLMILQQDLLPLHIMLQVHLGAQT